MARFHHIGLLIVLAIVAVDPAIAASEAIRVAKVASFPNSETRAAIPTDSTSSAAIGHRYAVMPTGKMHEERMSHTCTLLGDGLLLVTGGTTDRGDTNTDLASAELYHPETGLWVPTASLPISRSLHTATLLLDGTVLVAGGRSYSSSAGTLAYLSDAQIYDPIKGTWTPTTNMTTARADHTATLLSDGRVLIVGGTNETSDGRHALTTAELYDPSTGTWSATGTLSLGRRGHTATRLLSGKVLVVGAINADGGSVEIYDPATGQWTLTGRLPIGRWGQTATLLQDGTVLIAGGFWDAAFRSAELYDPSTGSWRETGQLIVGRGAHRAILLPDGAVLVVGGQARYDWLHDAEVYDPIAETWSYVGSFTFPANIEASPLLDGRILLSGGQENGWVTTLAELAIPLNRIAHLPVIRR
jgi:N-acetylneuraminic acid mutarotase